MICCSPFKPCSALVASNYGRLVLNKMLQLRHAIISQEDDEDEDEGDGDEPDAAGAATEANLDASAANGVAADTGDSPEGVNPQVLRREVVKDYCPRKQRPAAQRPFH